MSAIQITSADKKQAKRSQTSFDRLGAFSQGYFLRITAATSPSIANVISAVGVIAIPQGYVVGRDALRVHVDGILLPQPGVDYTEDTPFQVTLDALHVTVLNPTTSVIFIEWYRYLPGVRDQSFSDLVDVSADISAAVRDTSVLRSVATAANPLATLEDTTAYSGMAAAADVATTIGGPAVSFTLFAPLAVPADAKYLDFTYNAATTEPTVPSGLESQTAGDFTIDLVANTITGFGAGSAPVIGGVVPVAFNATALAGTPEISGCSGSFTVKITTLPTPGGTFQLTVAEANLTSGSYLSAGATARFRKY